MKKLRFLMIISGYPPFRSAGMEKSCHRLCRALAKRGFAVTVLTLAAEGLPNRETMDGVEVRRELKPLSIGPLWGLTYMRQVRKFMGNHREEWDVCVCHKLDLHSSVAAITARKLGKPCLHVLYNAETFSDLRTLAMHKGGKTLLHRALNSEGFFALSQKSRKELEKAGVSPSKIFTWRACIGSIDLQPGDWADGDHFLYIGRFHVQKNLPLLVAAFSKFHAHQRAARLVLIGKGDQKSRLLTEIQNSPASHAIEVRDWTDDPAAEMRRARAVVMSSNAEGLSNVLLEAMALGVPCISTDVSGAREALGLDIDAVIPEENFAEAAAGLIVPKNDAAALSTAMDSIWSDSELRRRLSLNGPVRVQSEFSEDRSVELFLRGIYTATGEPE